MDIELVWILQSLNNKNEIICRIEDELIAILQKPQEMRQFVEKMKDELRLSSDLHIRHGSFYYFYLAVAFHSLKEMRPAKEALARAVHNFRIKEHSLNEALGEWLFAKIHLECEDNIRAERACKTAIAILERLFQIHREEGHYKKVEECTKHLAMLETRLKMIRISPPVKVNERVKDVQQSAEQDYIVLSWLPIYDSIQGGSSGPTWAQPLRKSNLSIHKVEIDHRIFKLVSTSSSEKKNVNQITLIRGIEYGWSKVVGHSLNAREPETIEEGDYVLFRRSWQIDQDAIVIACHLISQTQHEYMVKKFIAEDCTLVSETDDISRDYSPIPLNDDYHILGTVIAIAKPI